MSEELDPEKYYVLTPNRKRVVIASLFFIFLVLVPTLFFVYYRVAIFRPSQSDKEVTLEIGKGDSAVEVAGTLYDKGAINSEFLFILYLFLNKADNTIKAGTSLVGVIQQLGHGTNDLALTFLEGWRVEEFSRLATQRLGNIDYKKFIDLAKPYEGYLFPDTYFVSKDVQEEDLIKLLRDTFDEKTRDILSEDNLKKVGLTKEQAVILASMVEREISNLEDKPIVAGILIKRWKEGVKLDIDATTQYVIADRRICDNKDYCIPTLEDYMNLNWWPKNLTREELDTNNPYNTRFVGGLPPTPISSVSLPSLEAVINYKTTPYYFYITGKDGLTYYAKDLDEHNLNVSKYLSN